jgi:hypothetical protein
MATNNIEGVHSWESMSDEEMLFVAGDFGMFWYDTKICQEKMLIINDILENKNSYIGSRSSAARR